MSDNNDCVLRVKQCVRNQYGKAAEIGNLRNNRNLNEKIVAIQLAEVVQYLSFMPSPYLYALHGKTTVPQYPVPTVHTFVWKTADNNFLSSHPSLSLSVSWDMCLYIYVHIYSIYSLCAVSIIGERRNLFVLLFHVISFQI